MPLINFKTDLKSLKYGGDRPGGGSSGLPYIQISSPTPDTIETNPRLLVYGDYFNSNRDSLDFPIRGGSTTLNGPIGRPITLAGEIDKARIEGFLKDKKRGPIFLLKQEGLQLSNPNIQVPAIPRTLFLDISKDLDISLDNEIIAGTRLYNPKGLSTIQQVLVQGTGTHIPRHGLLPVFSTPLQQTYEYYVTNNNTPNTNRLAVLQQSKLAMVNPILWSTKDVPDENKYDTGRMDAVTRLDYSNRYGISPLGGEILNYIGGPGSSYGVGYTRIRRAVDTTQAGEKGAQLYNAFTMTYQQLLNQDTSKGGRKSSRKLQDFRAQLATGTGLPGNFLTADYADLEGKQWYNPTIKGDPGIPEIGQSRFNYAQINETKVDQVNKLSPFYYNANNNTPWEAGGDNTKDIIKFAFECLDNDHFGDAVGLVFRAFMTSFTDNHQAEFNSFRYLGRGETFRTYQGFDRSISFGFKIAAFSMSEMRPLYAKLNHLVSQIYPDYSPNSNLMRGSVVKLTIGDYLYRVPGFLESVNITVDNSTSWEIALDPGGIGISEQGPDAYMNQLPQVVEVQCSFKPIHDFLPRRETIDNTDMTFIGNSETGYWRMAASRVITDPTGVLAARLKAEDAAQKLADQIQWQKEQDAYDLEEARKAAAAAAPPVGAPVAGGTAAPAAKKRKKKRNGK